MNQWLALARGQRLGRVRRGVEFLFRFFRFHLAQEGGGDVIPGAIGEIDEAALIPIHGYDPADQALKALQLRTAGVYFYELIGPLLLEVFIQFEAHDTPLHTIV